MGNTIIGGFVLLVVTSHGFAGDGYTGDWHYDARIKKGYCAYGGQPLGWPVNRVCSGDIYSVYETTAFRFSDFTSCEKDRNYWNIRWQEQADEFCSARFKELISYECSRFGILDAAKCSDLVNCKAVAGVDPAIAKKLCYTNQPCSRGTAPQACTNAKDALQTLD